MRWLRPNSNRRSSLVVLTGGLALVLTLGGSAVAGDLPPGGTFTDDDGNIHEGSIEAVAAAGVTKGCNPPANDRFCPAGTVTRGQMAAFLVRALGLVDSGPGNLFDDDDDSIFESDIDKLAVAGITKGCNPPTNNRFCPDSRVTRGETAAFLVRAFGYTVGGGDDLFIDDDGSVFESDIDKLGTAGVTKGCNPPINNRFCPGDAVARDQMATLLTRALGLTPTTPPLGPPRNGQPPNVPPSDFKVAFIGDQGSGGDAKAVLELVRDERAQMVLHQGDFDYAGDPDAWDGLITDVLGGNFPYFASVGNHDTSSWPGYQSKLYERLSRVTGASCTGDLGVRSSCTFNGLFFILSGVGTMGSDHVTYIEEELVLTQYPWRICSWHKNQREMQVGGRGDSTGWGVYEACREGGAIIATGHEHSYERTKTLIDVETQTVDPNWPRPDELRVARGSTFVFVSGLGGHSIRGQKRCLPATPPYGCNGEWANIYTSDQGATDGALFCSFNVDGQADIAECYFRDVDGNTPDQFHVTNFLIPEP